MSRWANQFKDHEFFKEFYRLKELVFSNQTESQDSQSDLEIARLKKVIAYIDNIISKTDPELISLANLSSCTQSIKNSIDQFNNFLSNKNDQHLQNTNNQIDPVLTFFSQTPFSLNESQKESLNAAVIAYSESMSESLEKYKNKVNLEIDALKSYINQINPEIKVSQDNLANLKQQLQTVEQTIQKQTAEFNTQYQVSENNRSDKFEKIVEQLNTKVDTEFVKLTTKTGAATAVLDKFIDDAKKIFGVVVNTLQAGAYSSYANEEKRTANLFRYGAIALMLASISILVYPELMKIHMESTEYIFDWTKALVRIPFSAAILVPAFYLARESNKHRTVEFTNRRRELILSTIDPYLSLLEKDKAEAIKAEIAKGIFSEGTIPQETNSPDLGNIVSQLSNLIKQSKS